MEDNDPVLSLYRIIVEIYVVGTLCVLGIAGNLLCIVVLGRDRTNHRSTGFLLQMLAVADAVYLVTCIFIQTLNCVRKMTDWLPLVVRLHWPYVELHSWPMASVAQMASVWLVVVLTADRYVAICHPMHAPQYSTISRLRKAVAAVWILAVVYNLPRFFERVVVVVDDEDDVSGNWTSLAATSSPDLALVTSSAVTDDGRRVMLRKTAMSEHSVYVIVYKSCLFFIVRFFVPFAALAFFNQRLIHAMRSSHQMRLRSAVGGSSSSKERQHTRTLVVVVLVFVICELPDLTLRFWWMVSQYAPDHVAFPMYEVGYVNIASNFLLIVNSCINFVIYCFMGRYFRLILLRMIGCGGERPVLRNR